MMHGLMMAAAIEAAEPAPDRVRSDDEFGRSGSVVLGEVIAARAMTPSPVGVGMGALGGVTAAWLSMSSQEVGGARYKTFAAAPSVDVFVVDGFSLGATIGGGITSIEQPNASTTSDAWHATFVPRIGNAITLADGVALWPRLGAGITLYDGPGQDKLGTVFQATFATPFVFRLARYVALEVGPSVSYLSTLSGPADQRGFSAGVSGGLSIVF